MRRPTTVIRSTLPLLTAVALLVAASPAVAGWSLFGPDESEAAPRETPPADANPAMVDSPLFSLSWPKIEMPKLSWKPNLGGAAAPDAGPRPNPVSDTLDRVATASKRAADGVREMWGSTLNKLSPGGDPTDPGAPGPLTRLFARDEQEPRGSATVQEFLAQERVGTTTR